ncbi:MAG: hypothetical protein WC728_00580 [Elusimicrobiota bacterium]
MRDHFAKLGCVLVLAAFSFSVVGDPIQDAFFPKPDGCPVCINLGSAISPAVPGPVIPHPVVVFICDVELPSVSMLDIERASHPNRDPPAA